MFKEKISDSTVQQRLVNALLLHSSFIDNLGLLNGKMGISICFYHLARQTGNPLYEEYAGELIDEIYEGINVNTSLDFADGLAGIGWGIEYLVQNNFIEADTDEVLEEFDKRLMPLIYSFPSPIGLENGLVGLGDYLLKRIQNPAAKEEKIQTLINKQLLVHLISELDRRTLEVAELIKEPLHNPATEKEPDQASTTKETTAFDLTWDYPVLLSFLAEVFQLNLYNIKVKSILQRLVSPLRQTENFPRLQSNRLLLACALVKLCKAGLFVTGQTKTENINEDADIGMIIQRLLSGIKRETISRELKPNCAFLKSGTMGIAWIYRNLFELTHDKQFETEAVHWLNESLRIEEANELARDTREEKSIRLGLMEGYAGLILMDCYHEKD